MVLLEPKSLLQALQDPYENKAKGNHHGVIE